MQLGRKQRTRPNGKYASCQRNSTLHFQLYSFPPKMSRVRAEVASVGSSLQLPTEAVLKESDTEKSTLSSDLGTRRRHLCSNSIQIPDFPIFHHRYLTDISAVRRLVASAMRSIALVSLLPAAPAVFLANVIGEITTSADGLSISCGRCRIIGCSVQGRAAEASPSRISVLIRPGDRGDDMGLG